MKRTYKFAAMIHPVESALPSRTARIQQGGDEAQHSRMTFYEAVKRMINMPILNKDEEFRKKAIFESMSPRRQKHIEKKGYEKWDPFEMPKDPIDIRKDKTKRTTQVLVREFLQSRSSEEYSNEYGRGALDFCLGIINKDDRYIGMFEFASWYIELLKKEGHELE